METEIELKAPTGKYRVVGVDTFDGTDWIQGDYDAAEEAIAIAKATGAVMLKTHVYDDRGRHVFQAGSF